MKADLESQTQKMAILNDQDQIRKQTSWDLDKIFIVEKLTIKKKSHNIEILYIIKKSEIFSENPWML